MDYKIDRENNLYIIKIDSLNNEVFHKVIKNIIEIHNIQDKIYCYYTYFNKDYSYCIIDFNRKKFNNDEVEEIIKNFVKKK